MFYLGGVALRVVGGKRAGRRTVFQAYWLGEENGLITEREE